MLEHFCTSILKKIFNLEDKEYVLDPCFLIRVSDLMLPYPARKNDNILVGDGELLELIIL